MAGGSIDVAIEESADGGIIVSAVQIVIARFGIVEIATIADGVGLADGRSAVAGDGNDVPPGIIFIFDEQGGVAVCGIEDTRDVALLVLPIPIGVGSLGEAVDFAGGVVDLELDGLIIVLAHPDQITTVVIIELGGAPEAGHPAPGMGFT